MKKLLALALTILSLSAIAAPVNTKYCNKLVIDSTNDLQGRVNRREMTVQRANLILEIVDESCKAAIRDGLSQSDYEGIFAATQSKDCVGLDKEIYPLMGGYDADDVEMVINKVEKMCRTNVLNNGTRLGLMLEMRTYLKSIGLM